MQKLLFELILASALTLGAILASAAGAHATDILVKDAFARASAVATASSGAAYVTITNNGAVADQLLSATAEGAASVMLHETRDENGVSSMMAMEGAEIAAAQTFVMKPGSHHLMLMGLAAPLKQGATLKLTLNFAKAGAVAVDVPVASVAASSPEN